MHPLADPARVSPELAPLVRTLLADPRPAYSVAAQAALDALTSGELVGLHTSSRRAWIATRLHAADPVDVTTGAVFQAHYVTYPPASARDIRGWIVTQDGFASTLVLVHELAHFRNRHVVWSATQAPAALVDPALGAGFTAAQIQGVRASLLNEIAARHTAYLTETGDGPFTGLPGPGQLFACAVKIASYPSVYNDCGVMQRLVDRADPAALADQVGLWLGGLSRFVFFEEGSEEQAAHAAWIAQEERIAIHGRDAPRVEAKGTL